MEKRIISTGLLEEDSRIESSLRPISLDEYIGQDKIKDNIKVYIEAANKEKKVLIMCFFTALRGLERPH